MKEPEWVCHDCATGRDASMPEGHLPTWHIDKCGICGEERYVTQPRDYGKDRSKLKVDDNKE